jgi:hypothetical protein
MLSILAVLALALVLTGIGWSVVSRLDSTNRLCDGERVVISFFVGTYAIYFGIFFIGPIRLDIITMSGLACVCVLAAIPGLKGMPWKAIYDFNAGVFKADYFSKLLLISVTVVALTTLLQGLAPPNDYDSLLYHLTIPLHDVEAGRIILPNDARGIQALFPAMTSNLTRFLLVFADGEAVQIAHGLFGLAAAAGTAMLLRRFGYRPQISLIAALFFLVIRAVIWQMASAETDVPMAGFLIGSFIVYLALREHPTPRLGILFGLIIGGLILTKYIGFALALSFGVIMIYDMVRAQNKWAIGIIGPFVSLLVILPHLARNFILTNNPIFPLFNTIFNPGKISPYGSIAGHLGTGREFVDLITAPWNIFVVPMQYFDGMVIGAPYLLAFCPFVFLDRKKARDWFPVLPVIAIFFAIWFYLLSQQVRFLIPLMPLIAAMAAAGLAIMWDRTRANPILKIGLIAIVAILGLNQAMFVGVYAAIRLPVAIGLMDISEYHSNTPTMNGAFYKTCAYIRGNLKPGETYYSGISFPSYYCPQVSVAYQRFLDEEPWFSGAGQVAQYSYDEFLQKMEKSNFRYLILITGYQSRRDTVEGYKPRKNMSAKTVWVSVDKVNYRFQNYIAPVLSNLKPLIQGPYSAVYDGPEVISQLKKIGALP